jgi:hypothetical protein
MRATLSQCSLLSGVSGRSFPTEVTETLAALAPIVEAGGGVVWGLHVVIGGVGEGGRWFELGWSEIPAVHCVVCWDADHQGRWWTHALAHWQATSGDVVSPRPRAPTVPWLTAELLPGSATCTWHQVSMLEDVERCVAWAIIAARQR